MARFFDPEDAPQPASNYSQAVEMPLAGRRLIISGQVGQMPSGYIHPHYEEQAEQAWRNIFAALAEVGMGAEDLVKITCFDVAPGNVAAFRSIRDRMLDGHKPASTYVVVSRLADDRFLTEIEAEAISEA